MDNTELDSFVEEYVKDKLVSLDIDMNDTAILMKNGDIVLNMGKAHG